MQLILASSSPRRVEILERAGYQFRVVPSNVDENANIDDPSALVKQLSYSKAYEVSKRYPEDVVIGADTVVFAEGKILGKPKDKKEAALMLKMLSAKDHNVFTGVSIVSKTRTDSFFVKTKVRFYPLDSDFINRYVETGDPLDKAGAYGIQGPGSLLVESIEGDYFNVMGLPVSALAQKLAAYGILPF